MVEGSPPADHGVLRSHLDESGPFKVYSAPPSERTRHAATHYRLMKRIATRALIELTPETGRRNQIRVHLADAECTIIGDRTYAARTNPARRLGLQQWQATHRTVVTERLTHVFWGNGDFDLAVDRAHTKYGVRTANARHFHNAMNTNALALVLLVQRAIPLLEQSTGRGSNFCNYLLRAPPLIPASCACKVTPVLPPLSW